jgi:acetyl-CoA C-acetyltransferase
MQVAEAYIVSAVRTAGGRRNGRLSGIHPVDLGARVLDAAVARAGLPGDAIDDVIIGCVTQAGEQAMHVGRHCVLASGLPQSVPAVTIDRQCGSSQQAIQFAAQAVMSGTMDIVIAGGTESMSRVPMGSAVKWPEGSDPLTRAIKDRYGIEAFSQFGGAEMIAKKWGFTRDALDAFGLESHQRAQKATKDGAFEQEILPIDIVTATGESEKHVADEGIRWDASPEGMGAVKLLMEGGVITAATSSQITDGASAVIVVSERALKEHNLTPLARIVNLTVTAGDPVVMLEEPLFATEKALARAGLKIGDIDLYEVNEAFAPVPMAWLRHHDADPAKLNAFGGAIALGHPLGATGTKLMSTLIYGLKRTGGKYGLQTMCEGGGIANVTIIEAL